MVTSYAEREPPWQAVAWSALMRMDDSQKL
jgi:hypothetical protein